MRVCVSVSNLSVAVAACVCLCVCVCACMCVCMCVLVHAYQPEQFGNMTRSLLTLMRFAAGETWVEGIPVLLENGEVNIFPATFIFLYIIVVTWTFLQVGISL